MEAEIDIETQIVPDICADHDDEKYHIEIELPGVKKEDIELKMGVTSVCIKAPREDVTYNACYTLAHEIMVDSTTATFENGLLTVNAPFKEPLSGKKIEIA
jgi:HSP20 family protein